MSVCLARFFSSNVTAALHVAFQENAQRIVNIRVAFQEHAKQIRVTFQENATQISFAFQVVVTVNGITGSCRSGNCTFTYEEPPQISGISPGSGPGGPEGVGTEVTITGSGFSSFNGENVVKIGDAPCVVKQSSASSIVCTAGENADGDSEIL